MKKRLHTLLVFGLLWGVTPPLQAQLLAKAQQIPDRAVPADQGKMRKLKDVLNELKNKHNVDILFFGKDIEIYEVPVNGYNLSGSLEKSLGSLLQPLNLTFKKSGRGGYVITEKRQKASQGRIEKIKPFNQSFRDINNTTGDGLPP